MTPPTIGRPDQPKERGLLRASLAWGDLRKTPYGLRPIAILIGIAALPAIGQYFPTVAGPNIAQDLHLDLRAVGGIFAAVGVISLVLAIPIGWVSDRAQRVRLVALANAIAGAAGIFTSQAVNSGMYTSGLVGQSASGLLGDTPTQSLVADYYPTDARGRVFSLSGSIGQALGLLSLVVCGLAVDRFGWRSTEFVLSLPFVLGSVLTLLLLREPRRGYFEKQALGFDEETSRREAEPASFGESWRTIWGVRMLRRLALSLMFGQIAGSPITVFLPFFLAERYGLDAAQRAALTVPSVLATAVGGIIGGGVIDVLGRRSPSSVLRFMGAAYLLPVGGLILFAIQPPLAVVILGSVTMSFGFGLTVPAYTSIFSQIVPARVRGQGLGVLSLANFPSQITLGVVFATVANTYGFGPMFMLCVPFLVVSSLLAISVADFYEGDRRNAVLATASDEEVRRAQEAGTTKLLVCRGVSVFYGTNQVLFGVDFEVEEGEIVALLGTNGAGKSTLLRAISGTQEAADGAIVLDGRDVTHMPPHEIAGRGAVHMPGGRGVFPGLTVEDNLRLGTWLVPPADVEGALQDAYERFPVLRERKAQKAGVLSGGEQQMVSLAQALMAKPRLLMIDELTLGLSPLVVGELLEAVREINRRGTTVIVVEQSVNVALTIADRAVFMEKGEIRFSGRTAELLARPDILRAVYVKGTATVGQARKTSPIADDAPHILEVRGVTKHFGGVTALDDVDLDLRRGEILGVLGPNGSGKTTLFDVISGYQIPDAGSITFHGEDVTSLSAEQRARLGLIRRFQDARLFPALTVTEVLLVALDQRMATRNLAGAVASSPANRRAERTARRRAEALIELLDLGSYRDKFVKELSTGLRRIVDIAWVLASEPKVLLLDEPSSGVAQAEAESLAPLLRRVRRETECSILLIEHDIPLISSLADRLVAMAEGQVLVSGPVGAVLDDERVIEAFLGTTDAAVHRSGVIK